MAISSNVTGACNHTMLPHYLASTWHLSVFLLQIRHMARIVEEAKGIKSDLQSPRRNKQAKKEMW